MSGIGSSIDQNIERHAISMNSRYHDGLVLFKQRCTDYPVIMQGLTDTFGNNILGISASLQNTAQAR